MKKRHMIMPCVLLFLAAIFLSGCGSAYEGTKENYTNVTSIPGYTFDVPSTLLSQTTAITNLSKDMDYGSDYYLYKNGENVYLLFNIDSIVLTVQSGTEFGFKDNGSDALTTADVNGIWFNADGNDSIKDTKGNNYKQILNVSAEVAVSTQTYGDFAGMVSSITKNDGEECTLFVGAPAASTQELTNAQKKIMEHIAKSFTATGEDAGEKETTEESVEVAATAEPVTESAVENTMESGEASPNTTEVTIRKIENTADQTGSNTVEIADVRESETDTASDEAVEVEVISDTAVSTPEEIKEIEKNDSKESDSKAEVASEKSARQEPTIETKEPKAPASDEKSEEKEQASKEGESSEKKKNIVTVESNQTKPVGEKSDIYHMLSIGETGRFVSVKADGETPFNEQIRIDKLFTGEDAVAKIKKLLSSKEQRKDYEEAPVGCSWHLIEYTLTGDPSEYLCDIRLRGLDGETLRSKGISYSQRTYDIYTAMESGASYTKLYCYYAVPNGCDSYALEIGCLDTIIDGAYSAYYLFSGN